jgi:hypothetical protein
MYLLAASSFWIAFVVAVVCRWVQHTLQLKCLAWPAVHPTMQAASMPTTTAPAASASSQWSRLQRRLALWGLPPTPRQLSGVAAAAARAAPRGCRFSASSTCSLSWQECLQRLPPCLPPARPQLPPRQQVAAAARTRSCRCRCRSCRTRGCRRCGCRYRGPRRLRLRAWQWQQTAMMRWMWRAAPAGRQAVLLRGRRQALLVPSSSRRRRQRLSWALGGGRGGGRRLPSGASQERRSLKMTITFLPGQPPQPPAACNATAAAAAAAPTRRRPRRRPTRPRTPQQCRQQRRQRGRAATLGKLPQQRPPPVGCPSSLTAPLPFWQTCLACRGQQRQPPDTQRAHLLQQQQQRRRQQERAAASALRRWHPWQLPTWAAPRLASAKSAASASPASTRASRRAACTSSSRWGQGKRTVVLRLCPALPLSPLLCPTRPIIRYSLPLCSCLCSCSPVSCLPPACLLSFRAEAKGGAAPGRPAAPAGRT